MVELRPPLVTNSCTFHPGQPVFHDAYKGWSCCNKKTTDFTQFLNTPGCTRSFHSNEKPPEAEKPVVDKSKADEVIVVRPPVQESLPRPPSTTPLTTLKPDIAPSVKQQLHTLKKTDSSSDQSGGDGTPAIGTSCKNGGCKASYEGVQSIDEQCLHHPGVAVFHEGMKFWSCCVKRTSDFNAFLEQAGCSSGKHVWFKKESKTGVKCRYDWHQTGSNVVVSVFAKKYDPFKSYVKLNPVKLVIHAYFPESEGSFDLDMELMGVVDVDQSSVSMLGTKIEVKLKKAEVGAWKNLHIPKTSVEASSTDVKEENNSASLESRVDAVDLSDL
ncbi:Cysteine and histidine-rich domain-containing protein [Frankliniella fusca]|uniref:Cysteine and histidine-rich domain-containing protein n=1 Tax=Frankliniella fusca TaxID=407009 RepID=A0AAE1HMA8_9NEOP|nr:Cysteine and histidine-rich domain-containing protein [Frankliniella fusca]